MHPQDQELARKFDDMYAVSGANPWTFRDPPQELLLLVDRLPRGRALDMGCGEGYNTLALAKAGFQATGADVSPRAIALANAHAREQGLAVAFLQKSWRDLPTMQGPFAFIMDWRFLQEIIDPPDRARYVELIRALLPPGGHYLSVAFSHRSPLFGTGRVRTADRGIRLCFAPPEELDALFRGFRVLERKEIAVDEKGHEASPAYWYLLQKP
ncbi:MAG: class I SAM-dependent methyltransferase [Candidatus Aenigmarchaeota archaeon]|nr:class I SAM-dependent methyltransferase [Candidatus Aenigmarchaeota archaeon]